MRARAYRVAAFVLAVAALASLGAGPTRVAAWGIALACTTVAIALWLLAERAITYASDPESIWDWRQRRQRPVRRADAPQR